MIDYTLNSKLTRECFISNYKKELERLDELGIEESLLNYRLDWDSVRENYFICNEQKYDDRVAIFKENIYLSADRDRLRLSFNELVKKHSLHCKSSIENIGNIIEKLEPTVKPLNAKEAEKGLNDIESKMDKINQKLLYKIYQTRYGDKHGSLAIHPKIGMRFLRVESAYVMAVDSNGVVVMMLSGTRYLKGGKKLGKSLTASSIPEGYSWYKLWKSCEKRYQPLHPRDT